MQISRNMLSARLKFWVTDSKVTRFFENRNIFFVLALGRSGTQFCSELLSKSPGSLVFHEPIGDDYRANAEAHLSQDTALKYISVYRKKLMYELARDKDFRTYGEVNSIIAYHAAALQNVFPQARFLHLIRDGREVVRSLHARTHYVETSLPFECICPNPGDPWYDSWKNFSRFQKLCWLWSYTNSYLENRVPDFVLFEKLISDYDYFSSRMETFLGVNVGRELWEKHVSKPLNVTRKFSMPPWSEWETEQREQFIEICGEEMARYGYPLE